VKLLRFFVVLLLGISVIAPLAARAQGDGGNHFPHHHVAALFGHAEEEQNDGHHQSGTMVGVEYIVQFAPRWGAGIAIESEVFDSNQNRLGIVAAPVSFFPFGRVRTFAALGIEFRERGAPKHALLRFGAGYDITLPGHISISPEAQADWVSGGTFVYVFALALGYGF